ncbi:MAG: hypothetical protein F9K25_20075 [Candidatus Contendobacter sp.]|nr:MAG: hypothetical protein F9K25_20075 [Candidatus Contendobacter sp.]
MNVLEVLHVGPVIPVLVVDDLAHAVPLAKALVAGGVRVLEVTLRTPATLAAIRAALAAGDWGRITELTRQASVLGPR